MEKTLWEIAPLSWCTHHDAARMKLSHRRRIEPKKKRRKKQGIQFMNEMELPKFRAAGFQYWGWRLGKKYGSAHTTAIDGAHTTKPLTFRQFGLSDA
jgi:hypothetical protein